MPRRGISGNINVFMKCRIFHANVFPIRIGFCKLILTATFLMNLNFDFSNQCFGNNITFKMKI
jgi:hypothetical protein